MKKPVVLGFLLVNLLIICAFWWNGSGQFLTQSIGDALIALGRLLGLLAVYLILLQVLLIGRAVWMEKTFGLDKLSQVHRLNGKIALFFILLHPILLVSGYSTVAKVNPVNQFLTFVTSYEAVLQAGLAVILFIIIVFTSLYIVRKKLKYEIWYFVHLFTYLAILLAFGHQLKNGRDFLTNSFFAYYWYGLYIFVFGNHLIFRFTRPVYLFVKHRFYVEKVVRETPDAVSIYISGKNLKDFTIDPGQFMFLRFLTKDFWWQSHPFSLSKVPDSKNLRVTIKNVGDFTSIVNRIKKRTPVIVDSGYGIFTQKEAKSNKILFIAGGIGITPVRSLIEQMGSLRKNVVLIYSSKRKKDVVFKREIDSLLKKYNLRVYYVLSQEKAAGFIHGRIDTGIITKLVKDLSRREVYICGPVNMIDALRKDLIKIRISPSVIHFEKFSL